MCNVIMIPVYPTADSVRGEIPYRKAKLYGWLSAGAVLMLLVFLVSPVSAATVTINNTTSGGISKALIDAGDGGTVILQPGTYFENSTNLTNRTTIKANISAGGSAANTIIDAERSGRVFDAGSHPLSIENLTLKNGNAANGGAIYSLGTVSATSCEFTNCNASNTGGGINSPSVTVTSCKFTDCTGLNAGGGIYSQSVTATSCNFTGCSADYGGSIYSGEVAIAGFCNFAGCTAANSGGAINSGFGGLTVTSSTFTGCSASGSDSTGGAIRSDGNVTSSSSTFTGCSAGGDGGAIYSDGGVTSSSSTFTGCSGGSAGDGGAIYSKGGVTVSSSAFTGCLTTDGSGGAFFSDGGVVTSSTFTNCSAESGSGGAFSLDGATTSCIVTSCTFTDCRADSGDGGAIDSGYGSLTVTSCTFTGCSVTGGSGGAINSGYGGVIVTSCTFTGCSAGGSGDGGAISSFDNLAVSASTFTECSADSGNGGAIRSSSGFTITSSDFTGCSAVSGGAIFFEGSGTTADLHLSRIYNCITGGAAVANDGGGFFNATNNWWGTNEDPNSYTSGGVLVDPWLVLGAVSDPFSIKISEVSVLSANLTYNSAGEDTSGDGFVPDGIPVAFTLVNGSGSLTVSGGNITSGINSTVFTPSNCGIMTINATADKQEVSVRLTVVPCVSFTASPLSGTVPLTVRFTDESTGSPTAWNWSFGDGSWFNTTDPALSGPVHTYSAAGKYTVSLTVSNAQGSFTFSRANYITVNSPTALPIISFSSGGGGSNTDTGTCFSTDLKAGNCTSFEIDKGAVCVVMITPGTDVGRIMITVRKDGSPPASIDAPGTLVYEYEDVTIYYADDSDLSGRTFCFRVKKSWLESNGYDLDDIVMLHYDEASGEWEELATTYSDEDGSYYYYSAETPSFSWFAIAVSEDATVVPESTRTVAQAGTEISTPVSSSVTVEPAAEPERRGAPEGPRSLYSLLIQILVVVLVVIVIIGFLSRKRREKYPVRLDHGTR